MEKWETQSSKESLVAAALRRNPWVCSPSCSMLSGVSMKSHVSPAVLQKRWGNCTYSEFLQRPRTLCSLRAVSVIWFSELRRVRPGLRCTTTENKNSTFQTDFTNKLFRLHVRQDDAKFGFLHQIWLPAVACQVKQEQVIVFNPKIKLPADILY